MRIAFRSAICLFFTLASLTSCGSDGVGPRYTAQHLWVLRTINGHRLPYLSNDDSTQLATTLYDTLALDINTDTAREIQSVADSSSTPSQVIVVGLKGIYALSSDSIRIRWLAECPPVCASNRIGSISGTSMTLTRDAAIMPRILFTYERVR